MVSCSITHLHYDVAAPRESEQGKTRPVAPVVKSPRATGDGEDGLSLSFFRSLSYSDLCAHFHLFLSLSLLHLL